MTASQLQVINRQKVPAKSTLCRESLTAKSIFYKLHSVLQAIFASYPLIFCPRDTKPIFSYVSCCKLSKKWSAISVLDIVLEIFQICDFIVTLSNFGGGVN